MLSLPGRCVLAGSAVVVGTSLLGFFALGPQPSAPSLWVNDGGGTFAGLAQTITDSVMLRRVPYSHMHGLTSELPDVDGVALSSAFEASQGDLCGLRRLLLKLQDPHANVSLELWGGSIAVGRGCEEPVDSISLESSKIAGVGNRWQRGQSCNYGLMLARRLARTFPARISFDNFAERGMNTLGQYQAMAAEMAHRPRGGPDLLILDHAENDAFSPLRTVPPAVENSIRALRCFAPETQIVLASMMPFHRHSPVIATASSSTPPRQHGQDVEEYYARISSYYRVPLLDVYRVDRHFRVWTPPHRHHPNWATHALVADMLAHLMNENLEALARPQPAVGAAPACEASAARDGLNCTDPMPPLFQGLPPELFCLQPRDAYLADGSQRRWSARGQDASTNAPKVVLPQDGSWRFFEDVAGKPGWIAERISAEWLIFPVAAGASRLLLQFLRSYEGVGRVEVRLSDAPQNNSYILDGLWQSRSSQTFTLCLHASRPYDPNSSSTVLGFGMSSGSVGSLLVRLVAGSKFKITSVISC
mmetsp:Transcript_17636/g.57170  ORF Transcript_17636/g.57170 Transcript_17636/m.57170 type:complete len:532 (+) Transcript_17636:162-1757(+)